ncbi:MAG: riboflavin synthase [Solirubrobacterales bacterium]
MFTGLVQAVGRVAAIEQQPGGGARLKIGSELADEVRSGESVMVNGVCLTAIDPSDSSLGADLSKETLARTTLGGLELGAEVNLELPLMVGGRLGGHVVQGHVDGVGVVIEMREDGLGRDLKFATPPDLLRYVVDKGSVTVDGVSLTATAVDQEGFWVSLVPETLQRTTFAGAQPGTRVNLEVDVIAKYVEKLVEGR